MDDLSHSSILVPRAIIPKYVNCMPSAVIMQPVDMC